MADLIDYLRDKLAHADRVVCICPTVWADPYPPRKGWSSHCAIHGRSGPGPDVYAVRSNDPELWVRTESIRPRRKGWWRR